MSTAGGGGSEVGALNPLSSSRQIKHWFPWATLPRAIRISLQRRGGAAPHTHTHTHTTVSVKTRRQQALNKLFCHTVNARIWTGKPFASRCSSTCQPVLPHPDKWPDRRKTHSHNVCLLFTDPLRPKAATTGFYFSTWCRHRMQPEHLLIKITLI